MPHPTDHTPRAVGRYTPPHPRTGNIYRSRSTWRRRLHRLKPTAAATAVLLLTVAVITGITHLRR